MLRSALVLLQLALVQQACALLVAPRPCAWHAACSEAGRSSSPLMLAKRKGKASRGSSSTPSPRRPSSESPSSCLARCQHHGLAMVLVVMVGVVVVVVVGGAGLSGSAQVE